MNDTHRIISTLKFGLLESSHEYLQYRYNILTTWMNNGILIRFSVCSY